MSSPPLSRPRAVARPGPSSPRADDAPPPGVIPLQPRPDLTRVVHYRLAGGWATAVMRHWRPGEARRCRLCPLCTAHDDGCLIVVGGRVAPEEAGLLDTRQDRPQAGLRN